MGFLSSNTLRISGQRLSGLAPGPLEHPDDQWFDLEILQQDGEALRRDDLAASIPHGGHPDDWMPVFGGTTYEPEQDRYVASHEDAKRLSLLSEADQDPADIDLLPPEVVGEPAGPISGGGKSFDFPIDVPEHAPAAEDAPSAQKMPLSPERRLAVMRASGVVQHLWVATERHRWDALVRLASVLEEFPHGSTVKALTNLARAGGSIEEIECLAALRVAWRDDPSLWLVRRHSPSLGWQTISGCGPLRSAFTWRLAWRLFQGVAADTGIDALRGELRDRWLHLRPRDCLSSNEMRSAFYSFPALLETLAKVPDVTFDSDLARSQIEGWPYDTGPDRGTFPAADPFFRGLGVVTAPLPGLEEFGGRRALR